MGDRLVIWGSGSTVQGRYLAGQDVANAAIISSPGSDLYSWDEGSVNSGEFSATLGSSFNVNFRFDTWHIPQLYCGGSSSGCQTSDCLYLVPSGEPFNRGSNATTSPLNCGIWNRGLFYWTYRNLQNGCNQSDSWLLQNLTAYQTHKTYSKIGFFEGDAKSRDQNIIVADVLIVDSTGVQSFPLIDPSSFQKNIIEGIYAIAISFADGTTKEVPLESCPEWVQVKSSNSCPDGTVRQCDHGATTCCYGCDNGRLVLIDQFNKSQ